MLIRTLLWVTIATLVQSRSEDSEKQNILLRSSSNGVPSNSLRFHSKLNHSRTNSHEPFTQRPGEQKLGKLYYRGNLNDDQLSVRPGSENSNLNTPTDIRVHDSNIQKKRHFHRNRRNVGISASLHGSENSRHPISSDLNVDLGLKSNIHGALNNAAEKVREVKNGIANLIPPVSLPSLRLNQTAGHIQVEGTEKNSAGVSGSAHGSEKSRRTISSEGSKLNVGLGLKNGIQGILNNVAERVHNVKSGIASLIPQVSLPSLRSNKTVGHPHVRGTDRNSIDLNIQKGMRHYREPEKEKLKSKLSLEDKLLLRPGSQITTLKMNGSNNWRGLKNEVSGAGSGERHTLHPHHFHESGGIKLNGNLHSDRLHSQLNNNRIHVPHPISHHTESQLESGDYRTNVNFSGGKYVNGHALGGNLHNGIKYTPPHHHLPKSGPNNGYGNLPANVLDSYLQSDNHRIRIPLSVGDHRRSQSVTGHSQGSVNLSGGLTQHHRSPLETGGLRSHLDLSGGKLVSEIDYAVARGLENKNKHLQPHFHVPGIGLHLNNKVDLDNRVHVPHHHNIQSTVGDSKHDGNLSGGSKSSGSLDGNFLVGPSSGRYHENGVIHGNSEFKNNGPPHVNLISGLKHGTEDTANGVKSLIHEKNSSNSGAISKTIGADFEIGWSGN